MISEPDLNKWLSRGRCGKRILNTKDWEVIGYHRTAGQVESSEVGGIHKSSKRESQKNWYLESDATHLRTPEVLRHHLGGKFYLHHSLPFY